MFQAVFCHVFVALCAMMPFARVQPASAILSHGEGPLEKEVPLILTFDDGPHVQRTTKILDILDQYGYRAIFFVVGERFSEHPDRDRAKEVLREILRRGHLIGNHTLHHDMGLCRRSEEKMRKEIVGNHVLIHETTGAVPVLFRAPGGIDCSMLRDTVKATGESTLTWDIDPLDWKWRNRYTNLEKLKQGVRAVQDRPGPHVILLHDIHQESVETLSLFLEWVQQEPHVVILPPERWVERIHSLENPTEHRGGTHGEK